MYADGESFLERVWADREERLYKETFGDLGPGIYPIPRSDFDRLGRTPDPRWLFVGVFESPPSATRPRWLYVSSGLSNPWERDATEQFSGLGVEFVLEAPTQARWALRCVHWLAAIQLVATARGELPLDYGHRLNLHNPIDAASSLLRLVLIAPPSVVLPRRMSTLGGDIDVLYCHGISESEEDFAERHGTEALLARLAERPEFPATDPSRPTVA